MFILGEGCMRRNSLILLFATILLFPACANAYYQVIDLGTLGGDRSIALSINNSGQIVGWAENTSGWRYATLFDPTGGGNNINLGTLGGRISTACSINNSGQIVDGHKTAYLPGAGLYSTQAAEEIT